MICQVAHCTRAARVELSVGRGLVLDVCRRCANEKTAKAFASGKNIGLYTYLDKPIVLPCEGKPPIPREVGFAEGVPRWSEAMAPWSHYLLPCICCGEEFVHHATGQLGRPSLQCEACGGEIDTAPTIQPPITDEQAEKEALEYAAAVQSEGNMSAKDEIGDFDQHKPPWGDAKPLWDHLSTPKLRAAAKEAYDERAAIIEYDGEQPRFVAEQEAYREIADKAVNAGLVNHEQLGLFG
jgi:hypothetical protein